MAWDFFPHSDVGPELAGYGLPAKTEETRRQKAEIGAPKCAFGLFFVL